MSGRILVIDDLSLNRTILKAKLTASFFQVDTAATGKEALAAIRTSQPELILLDFHMPDLNGLEICQIVRADPRLRGIPIILFSASTDRSLRLAALRAGADDFLTKPINETLMMGRIRSLLRTYRQFAGMAQVSSVQMAMAEAQQSFAGQSSVALIATSPQDAALHLPDLRSSLPQAKRSILSLQDAMQMPQDRVPDLFILSPSILDMRGLQIIADLRSRSATAHAQVVVLLAPDKQGMAAMALDLGAADILSLPLDVEDAELRLNMLLKRKAATEAQNRAVEAQLDLAVRDSLTGLPNRRYLDSTLRDLANTACDTTTGPICAALMVDLDHFKQVNDHYGHVAGDRVLQQAAHRMKSVLRDGDCIARFGGEEFVIVLPKTGCEQAQAIAEQVGAVLRKDPFALPGGQLLARLTASIGVAVADAETCSPERFPHDLIARADRCLSVAKSEGRDRIITARAAMA